MTLYVPGLYPRMTAGVHTDTHNGTLGMARCISGTEAWQRGALSHTSRAISTFRQANGHAHIEPPQGSEPGSSIYLFLSCRQDRKTQNIPPPSIPSFQTHIHVFQWEGTPPMFLTQTHSSLTRLYTVTGYPVAPKIAA